MPTKKKSVLPADFDPDAAAVGETGIYGLPFAPADSKVVVVPVPFEATTSYGGGTSNGPQAVFEASKQVLLDLLVVWFLGRYETRPMYVFGGFGFVCWGISLASGAYAVWRKLFDATSFIQTPAGATAQPRHARSHPAGVCSSSKSSTDSRPPWFTTRSWCAPSRRLARWIPCGLSADGGAPGQAGSPQPGVTLPPSPPR